MKYMGSKNRIANEILPLMLKNRNERIFVDLFCGGMNISDKVDDKRICSDSNRFLIAMWIGLQQNRKRPYTIDKPLYDRARTEYNNNINIEFDDFMIGWIGFMGSFRGCFFAGGYSGKSKGRDYIAEQIRNTEKQIDKIKDVTFVNCSYDELEIPENSIIYCDIPYQGTKQYSDKNFDYDKFWNWCKNTSKTHDVFISEYNVPDDFECIWSKQVTNSMNTTKTYKPIEKLFKFKR